MVIVEVNVAGAVVAGAVVVEALMVSVVTDPTGQLVTSGGHEVIVYTVVTDSTEVGAGVADSVAMTTTVEVTPGLPAGSEDESELAVADPETSRAEVLSVPVVPAASDVVDEVSLPEPGSMEEVSVDSAEEAVVD